VNSPAAAPDIYISLYNVHAGDEELSSRGFYANTANQHDEF